MGGRPREFDETAVLDAAMNVFWSNGYAGSSAQALVDETGLGRGSLYNAFGSKENLYHQALQRYQALGLQTQTQILEGEGSVRARLRALLEWGIESDLDPEQRRSCMALSAALERAGKDPEVARITRRYVMKLEQALCHVFALGQRSGELDGAQSALVCARAFLSSYYGLRILGQSMPDRAFLQDVVEGILSRL
ncbi:TetR/AcrR family transcriptional regulator [Affinibrenneria salicis]|uniref:TetR/AcrR family transcriptional regulator n=1 Tax=Affinibrenneria salicis TaxID=2590031 RepID=A0A5J5FWK9_9GAMM|nr:TetR/AcrR family transcriptional regulator [Affinibrenneria salicis]KAA8998056.1 TetR/AcrR family transcriptional regulator [Affinibrenneria salicis]